jgi:hypothetical protein
VLLRIFGTSTTISTTTTTTKWKTPIPDLYHPLPHSAGMPLISTQLPLAPLATPWHQHCHPFLIIVFPFRQLSRRLLLNLWWWPR